MNQLQIQLFGTFHLRYNQQPVTIISSPRLQALLAYLSLHPQQPIPRQRLAFLFWPDSTEAQARTNLRKQILNLRQALPEAADLILSKRQTIQLNPKAELWSDVVTFRQAIARAGEDEVHVGDALQVIAVLKDAVSLYQGDLLQGCYDEWLLPEREALRTMYLHALAQLIQRLETARDYPAAIAYAQQLLNCDPVHESAYRRLMRLHALNGDRATALRVYHTCVTQLQNELEVAPAAETQALYDRLRRQQLAPETNRSSPTNAPFVGRIAEWQTLQELWQANLREQAHFAVIQGEAGIGKSRLAAEFLSWAHHQDFSTAYTRSYAAEGTLAYAPVVTWLRSATLAPQLTRIDEEWRLELVRLLPELATAQEPVATAPMQSWQRHRLFEALANTVLAARRPLLLVIDDLQWCDQETLEWLHFFMRYSSTADVLIIGTVRTEEIPQAHPLNRLFEEVGRNSQLTRFALQPLSALEMGELVQKMTNTSLSDDERNQIYQETEGHPLFVVEMVHAKSETQGAAHNSATIAAANHHKQPLSYTSTPTLPAKIRTLIGTRLGRLSPEARRVAGLAATIGREFTFPVLAVADDSGEVTLVDALDELWQRRIIREQGEQAYDFTHDKIREVVYAEISQARRRLLHRRVAEALISVYGPAQNSTSSQIAVHFDRAGQIRSAIDYYRQAAEDAQQLFAYTKASSYLQRALHLLETLPPSAERDQQELDILTELVIPLVASSLFTSGELNQIYERVHVLSEQLECPPSPSILRTLAIRHLLCNRDFDRVERWGRQILSMAHQSNSNPDPVLFVEAHYVLGVNAFWQGHFMAAQAALQAAVDHYSTTRHEIHAARYGQDPGVYCRVRLGWTLWYLGYPDQAYKWADEAITLARQLNHPLSLDLALLFSTWLYCDSREFQAAAECYANASGLVKRQQQKLAGYSSLLQGKLTSAIEQISADLNHRRDTNSSALYHPHTLGLLAEVYGKAGRHAEAFTHLDQAFDDLNGLQDYWDLAELYRRRGMLLQLIGAEAAEIEVFFQKALSAARRQCAKSLELRAAMCLTQLWIRQGKQAEAWDLLGPIYDWFTEGFATPDLREAKALLDKLSR